MTGSIIADRFELGEFIAQGGMGAVYRGVLSRRGMGSPEGRRGVPSFLIEAVR